jgi:hypothetical protein
LPLLAEYHAAVCQELVRPRFTSQQWVEFFPDLWCLHVDFPSLGVTGRIDKGVPPDLMQFSPMAALSRILFMEADEPAETGQTFNQAASGELRRRRLPPTLRARFRFAMIEDGLGFQLVPWTPSLEKQLGRHVSGVARDDGGVGWGFGRNRGLGF